MKSKKVSLGCLQRAPARAEKGYLSLNMTVHGLSCDRIVIYLSERNPLTFLSGVHLQVSKSLNREHNLGFRQFNSSMKCFFFAGSIHITSFHKDDKSRCIFSILSKCKGDKGKR